MNLVEWELMRVFFLLKILYQWINFCFTMIYIYGLSALSVFGYIDLIPKKIQFGWIKYLLQALYWYK